VSALFFFVFLYRHAHLPPLLSFPTRRSSDLESDHHRLLHSASFRSACTSSAVRERHAPTGNRPRRSGPIRTRTSRTTSRPTASRSEEHTSELQSRVDLVCRLLLEKKKQNKHN